jgi:thiol:disulfide interchange protein DsbA
MAFLGMLVLLLTGPALAASQWVEGRNYSLLNPVQRTTVPAGKVEVLEVFSYGCPACNSFQPVIESLMQKLPANAQMAYLPASFNPSEAWPMYQRAYFAAQALGIADKTHQAIYDAAWKTGELSYRDPATGRMKKTLPTIEDAARCYARLTGVKPEAFLAAAKSFGVEAKMRAADAQVMQMAVPGTPCIVVNGKYRVNMDTIRNQAELNDLVNYLVAKETPARK